MPPGIGQFPFLVLSVKTMKKKSRKERNNDLRPEYDFGQLLNTGVQGKYARRFAEGTNLVLLAPDVAEAFPTAESVNETLRLVLQLTQVRAKRRKSSGRR
jgi:hypothetical protein